jgi:hypothetical protein
MPRKNASKAQTTRIFHFMAQCASIAQSGHFS